MVEYYRFKELHSFQSRQQESRRALQSYPDRRPIICEKQYNQSDLPDIDKRKYLVTKELTVGQFIYVIRKRMRLTAEEALFVFVNNKLMPNSASLWQIYATNKDEDGFLYVRYAKENVFG